MEKILITITGIGAKDEGKYQVSIGDKVLLSKEPTNEFDADAIRVLTPRMKDSVGYVANSENTVQLNCHSATEIQPLFESEVQAKIIDTTTITFKNGRESMGYIAEVLLQTKKVERTGRELTMANTKTYKIKLIGSVTLYPNKFAVAEQVKKGFNPVISLKKDGDKILAFFDNVLCGYVDPKETEGMSSFEDVKDLMVGERLAKVTGTARQNFVAEFTIGEEEMATATASETLEDLMGKVVTEGIVTKAELDKIIAYLDEIGATKKQRLGIFSTYKTYDDEVSAKIPNPKEKYKDSTGLMTKAIAYINMGRNPLFEGDRGVGKNVALETLAWVYQRPLYEFAMNSQHDNNSMLGGKTFADVNDETNEESLTFFNSVSNVFKSGFGLKNLFKASKEEDALEIMSVFKKFISYFTGTKKLKYDPDIIVQAAEVGGFLELGEFNTAFGHVNSILNPLLDDRRRLHVPGYKTVNADSNFIAVATQNRNYSGTFENNEATIDRFVPIIFPTLTSIEDVLIAKVPGISLDIVDKCQTLFRGIKDSVEDGRIDERTISIRGFIDACLVTKQDIPLKDALIDNIANRATDTDERQIIKLMIEDILG